jgi:hypothetical protein
MDVISELLPHVNQVKSAHASKDSPQHKQHPKNLAQYNDEQVTKDETNVVRLNVSELEIVDRRSGDDRRQNRLNRGRWLESRDRSDRRALTTSVFVKI